MDTTSCQPGSDDERERERDGQGIARVELEEGVGRGGGRRSKGICGWEIFCAVSSWQAQKKGKGRIFFKNFRLASVAAVAMEGLLLIS